MKMKVVSYNLRYMPHTEIDGINNFTHRIGMIFEKICAEMPDIIGFQEVLPRQHLYLERMLTEYTIVGQFRDADFLGEGNFVALRKDRFQVLGYDTFWLSPTPYVPASRFEGQSDCPRICNVIRARHRQTNKIFRIFNTHLDHIGEEARVKGIGCILQELERLNAITEFPAMIMGDFNAYPDSETIRLCETYEKYPLVDATAQLASTFHWFGTTAAKIDYLYMTHELADKVTAFGQWDDVHEGIYLSDHTPIWADVELGE